MGFGSISHWLVILLIIVLLFGAKKIPELAKGVGKGIKTFKKEMADDAEIKATEEIKELADDIKNTESSEVKSEQKA